MPRLACALPFRGLGKAGLGRAVAYGGEERRGVGVARYFARDASPLFLAQLLGAFGHDYHIGTPRSAAIFAQPAGRKHAVAGEEAAEVGEQKVKPCLDVAV